MKHKVLCLFVLASLFHLSASASIDPFSMSLEELMTVQVVSAAAGRNQALSNAPAVASVITSAEIRHMGATTLDEALEHIPGLHISLSTIKNLNHNYVVRGMHISNTPQVLLTINGVPQQDYFTGSRMSSLRLPVANISRIEVIRGPGSAIHGADAFAGVINVITKNADELGGLSMGARLGSFSSKDSWLQYGSRLQNWHLALSFEHSISDGDSSRRVEQDAATPLGVSLAPLYPLQTRYNILNGRVALSNEQWDMSLSSWLQRDAGVGAGIAHAIDPVGGEKVSAHQFDLNYRWPNKIAGWAFSSRWNWQQFNIYDRFMMLPAGAIVPVGDDGNIASKPNNNCPIIQGEKKCLTQFVDGLWGNPNGTHSNHIVEVNSFNYDYPNHVLRINVGVAEQHYHAGESKNFGPGTPAAQIGEIAVDPVSHRWTIPSALTDVTGSANIYIKDVRRQNGFVALQDEWQFMPTWTLTSGLRYDHYSDFGKTFNPRLALVWEANNQLTSKLLYGSAFRAPAFFELFTKNNPALTGNPELKPEKMHTVELAFDYHPSQMWQHNFNTYYYQAKDLIGYISTPAGLFSENLNSLNGQGIELESKWNPSAQLQLSAAFAWQHTENRDNHSKAANAPGRELSAALWWRPQPSLSIYSNVNRVMGRMRELGDSRAKIPDYTLVNLTVRKQLTSEFELATSVRNLFNTNAREPSTSKIPADYPLERRSIYAELRYHFKRD